MRQARVFQFDMSNPPWMHCVSRCVRGAHLCAQQDGQPSDHRLALLEARLCQVARYFAVEVGAYALMSNHLHVVVRPLPEASQELSSLTVAQAWAAMRQVPELTQPSGADRSDGPPVWPFQEYDMPEHDQLERMAGDEDFVATWRQRLGSIGWFMKLLKQPVALLANREDGCAGAFWEGRFSSVPLLDDAALLAALAYVDLNPVRSATTQQLAQELGRTSLQQRLAAARVRAQVAKRVGKGDDDGARAVLRRSGMSLRPGHRLPNLDRDREDQVRHWLLPMSEIMPDAGVDLVRYRRLIDETARQIRSSDSASFSASVAALLNDLGHDPERWSTVMGQPGALRGTALGSQEALQEEARRRKGRWVQKRSPLFSGGRRPSAGADDDTDEQ